MLIGGIELLTCCQASRPTLALVLIAQVCATMPTGLVAMRWLSGAIDRGGVSPAMKLGTVRFALTVVSILMALSCMVSYWHPLHFSDVGGRRAEVVELKEGMAWWHYEVESSKFDGSGVWTSSDWSVPFLVYYHAGSFGYNSIGIWGLSLHWCCQPTGYRQFGICAGLLELATLAALYPTLSISIRRARRYVRRRRGHCLDCAYDLAGNVSGKCPERGAELSRGSGHAHASQRGPGTGSSGLVAR